MTDQIKQDDTPEVDAFDEAVAEIMSDDTSVKDTSTDEEKVVEDKDVEAKAESESESDNINDVVTEDEPELDYKALYDQAKANNAHLQDNMTQLVEERFNSWRGRVEEDIRKDAVDATKVQSDTAAKEEFKMSAEMEEVFELYPDLFPQVQSLIDNRVTKEVAGVEDRVAQLIDQQVTPITARVTEAEEKAHEDAILKSHPDIRDHIASGNFRKWVETLAPFQQQGAHHVCERGSAEEVIALFDSYKAATQKDAPTKSPKKSATAKTTTMVDKVKDAIAVPTEPEQVKLDENSSESEDPAKMFAEFSKQIMAEEAM